MRAAIGIGVLLLVGRGVVADFRRRLQGADASCVDLVGWSDRNGDDCAAQVAGRYCCPEWKPGCLAENADSPRAPCCDAEEYAPTDGEYAGVSSRVGCCASCRAATETPGESSSCSDDDNRLAAELRHYDPEMNLTRDGRCASLPISLGGLGCHYLDATGVSFSDVCSCSCPPDFYKACELPVVVFSTSHGEIVLDPEHIPADGQCEVALWVAAGRHVDIQYSDDALAAIGGSVSVFEGGEGESAIGQDGLAESQGSRARLVFRFQRSFGDMQQKIVLASWTASSGTCSDGLRDPREQEVDCGGPCPPCPRRETAGCTQATAPNFDPQAYRDDGPCQSLPVDSDECVLLPSRDNEFDGMVQGRPPELTFGPCPTCRDGILPRTAPGDVTCGSDPSAFGEQVLPDHSKPMLVFDQGSAELGYKRFNHVDMGLVQGTLMAPLFQGSLDLESSRFLIQHVTFGGRSRRHTGVSAISSSSIVVIYSCYFSELFKEAPHEPGGAAILSAGPNSAVAVYNTAVEHCGTTGSGGAIWSTGGVVIVRQSTFRGNYAMSSRDRRSSGENPADGGAIFIEGGTLQIEDCVFALNHISLTSDPLAFKTITAQGDSLRIQSAQSNHVAHWVIKNTTFEPFSDRGEHLTVSTSGVRTADCEQNRCPVGYECTYSEYSLACARCPATLVSLDGISCTTCLPGSEASAAQDNCTRCTQGYSLHGTCQPCEPGSEPKLPEREGCVACKPGKASVGNSTGLECTNCPVDSSPNRDGTACVPCTATEAFSSELSRCVCAAGYERRDGVYCVPCTDGFYKASGGDDRCAACEQGAVSYSPVQLRATGCICPAAKYNRTNGVLLCYGDSDYVEDALTRKHTDADVRERFESERLGYHDPHVVCLKCPVCATCGVGDQVSVNEGHSLSMLTAAETGRGGGDQVAVFSCPHEEACLGGNQTSLDSVCRPGETGPLCAICLPGYGRLSRQARCRACTESSGKTVGSIVLLFGAACFAVVVILVPIKWYRTKKQRDRSHEQSAGLIVSQTENPTYRSGSGAESNYAEPARKRRKHSQLEHFVQLTFHPVKIIITFAQVLSTLGPVLHVKFPPIIDQISVWLRFFMVNLRDWVEIDCVKGLDYYALWTINVFALPFLLLGLVQLRYLFALGQDNTDAEKAERAEQKMQRRSSFFFVLFLLYPNICNNAFGIFNCRVLGPDAYFLVEDFRVSCSSDLHALFQCVAFLVIIFVAIGVPTAALAMLIKSSKASTESSDAEIASKVCHECGLRNGSFTADMVKDVYMHKNFNFMIDAYRSRMYYWESIDLMRKCLLTGAIVLFGRGSVAQVILALCLCFLFFSLQMKMFPYRHAEDNWLKACTEAQIFLTVVVAMLLKCDMSTEAIQMPTYDTLLVCSFMFLTPIPFVLAIWAKRRAFKQFDLDDTNVSLGRGSTVRRDDADDALQFRRTFKDRGSSTRDEFRKRACLAQVRGDATAEHREIILEYIESLRAEHENTIKNEKAIFSGESESSVADKVDWAGAWICGSDHGDPFQVPHSFHDPHFSTGNGWIASSAAPNQRAAVAERSARYVNILQAVLHVHADSSREQAQPSSDPEDVTSGAHWTRTQAEVKYEIYRVLRYEDMDRDVGTRGGSLDREHAVEVTVLCKDAEKHLDQSRKKDDVMVKATMSDRMLYDDGADQKFDYLELSDDVLARLKLEVQAMQELTAHEHHEHQDLSPSADDHGPSQDACRNVIHVVQEPFLERFSRRCVYCMILETVGSPGSEEFARDLSNSPESCAERSRLVSSMSIDVLSGLEAIHARKYGFGGKLTMDSIAVTRTSKKSHESEEGDGSALMRTISEAATVNVWKVSNLRGVKLCPSMKQQDVDADLRAFAGLMLKLLIGAVDSAGRDDSAALTPTLSMALGAEARTLGLAELRLPKELMTKKSLGGELRRKLLKLQGAKIPEAIISLLARELSDEKGADSTNLHGHKTANGMKQALINAISEREGFFLSHVQGQAAIQMMALKGLLKTRFRTGESQVLDPNKMPLVWLDQDETPTTQGMQTGVREAKNFLLFLTTDYFTRYFCKLEVREALKLKKNIVLVHETDLARGGASQFGDLLDSCRKHCEDCMPVFDGSVSIPYYTEQVGKKASVVFADASLDEIMTGGGYPPPLAEGRPWPRAVADGKGIFVCHDVTTTAHDQAQIISNELQGLCPALAGKVPIQTSGLAGLAAAKTVVFFLTETAVKENCAATIQCLAQARLRECELVVLVECDNREGFGSIPKDEAAELLQKESAETAQYFRDAEEVMYARPNTFRKAAMESVLLLWQENEGRAAMRPRQSSEGAF